ncbi:MAG TPA: 4-alpha-glucanotransferase [Xanthobacteraceae bacterium]|nr:4-alpha-glucanotransferase [Xanthobacteraceae bacterium]
MEYRDAQGLLRSADPQGLARVMAVVAETNEPARRLLSRTVVVPQEQGLQLRLTTDARTAVRWEISSDAKIVSGTSNSATIRLPGDLPLGIYGLKVVAQSSGKERIEEATLLRAPPLAFQGSETGPRRLWALAVQLYGVRSRRNWGHGDFTDLLGLLELAAELGAGGVALNPLHALFDDDAGAASPYSPNSRLFLNSLYIDVEAIPEFPGLDAAGLRLKVEPLAQHELVDHAGVASAKTRALALAYANFRQADATRWQAFESFRRERGPVLARFACFEFLRRRFGKPWREWPELWRNPAEEALGALTQSDGEAIGFFEFVQWAADQQLQACRRRAHELGLPIGLYLDVAVGVHPDGFDAWSDQGSVMTGLAVGAPPDVYNTAGQNWGLAAFNPVALEARQFQPFRAMLQASMRNAGAVRLDHVLGLKRLFLIPDGMRPGQGVYVRYPFEALLAVSAQESVRHRCIVIGEALGTVPEDFQETLSDWGIWSYQVMLFERAADGSFLPPESYRQNALVTFSTHDLATFAGWQSGHDLAVKRALDMDPGETDAQRTAAHRALHRALSAHATADLDFVSVARYLAQTPARLLVVAIEDALGIRDQANIPATIDEHPNWRRRLPVQLEDLKLQSGLTAVADVMVAAGRSIR